MIVLESNQRDLTTIIVEPHYIVAEYGFTCDGHKTEYQVRENLWDCLGDVMLCVLFDNNKRLSAYDEILLRGECSYSTKYYDPEGLFNLYVEIQKKGWKIKMENDNGFYLRCPEFDEINQGALALTNESILCIQKRNYAHPIDSGIIKVLDMPGIKTVFASAVDMLTDLNYSQIISSGIPVNSKSFPEINKIVDHCVSVLGIKRPYVVVSGAIALNAFTVGSDDEPYIVLGNMLVRVMDPVKLEFIIGHECGHIAMGHVVYHTVVSTAGSFSNAIPVIGPIVYNTSSLALTAWSRRSEITADRAGLLCCLNLEEAKKSLLQLQSGFIDANQLDINNYVKNSKRYRRRSVLRRVNEFVQAHPPLPKRIEALDLFANSELYYEAQGQAVPVNCLSERELTRSVEHIIAVLGEE